MLILVMFLNQNHRHNNILLPSTTLISPSPLLADFQRRQSIAKFDMYQLYYLYVLLILSTLATNLAHCNHLAVHSLYQLYLLDNLPKYDIFWALNIKEPRGFMLLQMFRRDLTLPSSKQNMEPTGSAEIYRPPTKSHGVITPKIKI